VPDYSQGAPIGRCVLMRCRFAGQSLVLTRFLYPNRYPARIKCGAGFRWKTL
jgi:hypothetical protein